MKPKKDQKSKKIGLAKLLKVDTSLKRHKLGSPASVRSTPRKDAKHDFKTFLSSKENVEKFREFLDSQFCRENIDFYLACEKYRNLDRSKAGSDMVKFMANQIYNDFLGPQARQLVNINYECLENIRWQIKNPNQSLFNDAQKEIFILMENDCYLRYRKTLVDSIGAKKRHYHKLIGRPSPAH